MTQHAHNIKQHKLTFDVVFVVEIITLRMCLCLAEELHNCILRHGDIFSWKQMHVHCSCCVCAPKVMCFNSFLFQEKPHFVTTWPFCTTVIQSWKHSLTRVKRNI